MKVIRSRHLPPRKFDAINILGVLFCRPGTKLTSDLLTHEAIHSRQMYEMAIVFFYLWYILEWLLRLPFKGNAYRNISFEREAYANMHDPDYPRSRPYYAWTQYLFRRHRRGKRF